MTAPSGTAYVFDTRVIWAGLGSPPGLAASIIDPVNEDNSRLIMIRGDHFVVCGAFTEDASLYDEGDRYNQRLAAFGTVDEAIAAIIGEARQPRIIGSILGEVTAVPIYAAHLQWEQRFVGPGDAVYEVRSEYPHTTGLLVYQVGAHRGVERYGCDAETELWLILA